MALGASPSVAAETALRLRIAWGGGSERQWQGTVELPNGTLSELAALGMEADEPGSIWLDASKTPTSMAMIRQRSVRAYDGVDLLATADLAGSLIVRLGPVGEESDTKRFDIPLKQLVGQSYAGPIDNKGNRLLVIRSPGDKLRVTFRRSSLVFAPGETWNATLEPHLLGLPGGTPLRIKAQLASSSGSKGWSKEFDSVTPPSDGESGAGLPLEIKLPDLEGVYDLTLTAINASLRERLPWKRPLAERKVQLVVVGDKPARAPTADSQTLVRIVEIDPANPHSWERFTQLISNGRKEPLGSGDAARWDHPQLGSLVQLGSTKEATGWEAYPLPIPSAGQPHVLEIEYPSDVPQTLGISLVEPNAAGAVMPIGLDSGVYVSDEDAQRPSELLKHRIVFWPKTKLPIVLVTNRRHNSRAVFGKIRVLSISAGRRRLVRSDSSEVTLGRAFAKDAPAGGRLIAGYLERPLFTENFSAPESLDAFSHRSLDDWNTFYLGACRLVEYLNYAGYNGLMLTVAADGSTIYPSRQIESTPRHDTGVFFANGQDPIRKDVLELLFRLFDREGLALVPSVQFSAPLAELERWRHEAETTPTGLEWIGADGTSRASHMRLHQGLGPYYNPLNPRVQQAMLGVISELVDRYGAHASLRGVGVQLSADGYAQLPGSDGSFDDDTIERFEREAKVEVPGKGPERFAARGRYLTGPGSQAWLAWRADNMSDLFRRMSQVIAGSHKDAQLYLAGGTMLDGSAVRRS
ncbi:MAG TPA: family 10 glycosylhydrolase, partial [Pirellulales bacterium]|nr:family 10 glycosylhydrolase [Pirellulales bacterium]